MPNPSRTIVLYPGESITIGDTVVKVETRGGQFIGSSEDIAKQIEDAMKRGEQIKRPPAPQQIPGTSNPPWPQGPWINPNDPLLPGKIWYGVAQGAD